MALARTSKRPLPNSAAGWSANGSARSCGGWVDSGIWVWEAGIVEWSTALTSLDNIHPASPTLDFRTRVTVFDLRVEESPNRTCLHQTFIHKLGHVVILINTCILEFDFKRLAVGIVSDRNKARRTYGFAFHASLPLRIQVSNGDFANAMRLPASYIRRVCWPSTTLLQRADRRCEDDSPRRAMSPYSESEVGRLRR
jgi:hypothetical protein